MKIFIIIFTLVISLASFVEAAQIRVVEDNAEIAAVISFKEVNRISIENDRIVSLAAVPRGFSIDHDDVTGDLFLVPDLTTATGHPINLFITSEGGQTYQLILSPRDIPSEQILLRSSAPLENDYAGFSSPRREEISELMRRMITGEFLRDYKRSAAPLVSDAIHWAHVIPQEIWAGRDFYGMSLLTIGNKAMPAPDALAPGAAAVWVSEDQTKAVIILEGRYEE